MTLSLSLSACAQALTGKVSLCRKMKNDKSYFALLMLVKTHPWQYRQR
jgi:hypothetical protein